MTNIAKEQFNGLVLLTGYLQRLYVAETIHKKLNGPFNEERFENLKSMLETSLLMMQLFESTKELTVEQKTQLQTIFKQAKDLLASYFKVVPLSFNEKVAIVGSSLYAEQHINAGIIRLGEVFKVEINRDFKMRVKFYEDRVKFIDYLVHTLQQNENLEEKIKNQIDSWFNDVMKNKEGVINDFEHVSRLIGFES